MCVSSGKSCEHACDVQPMNRTFSVLSTHGIAEETSPDSCS